MIITCGKDQNNGIKLDHSLDLGRYDHGRSSFYRVLLLHTTGLALRFTLACHNSDDLFKAFIV